MRRILTTEYTEAVESYLKDTERFRCILGWERNDLSRVLEWLKGGEERGRFGFITNQK